MQARRVLISRTASLTDGHSNTTDLSLGRVDKAVYSGVYIDSYVARLMLALGSLTGVGSILNGGHSFIPLSSIVTFIYLLRYKLN